MAKTARVDFAKLLNNLIAKGVSLAQVSDALEVSPAAPYRWLQGSEPLHSNGEALLLFYSKHVSIAAEIHHAKTERGQARARTETETSTGADDEINRPADPARRRTDTV